MSTSRILGRFGLDILIPTWREGLIGVDKQSFKENESDRDSKFDKLEMLDDQIHEIVKEL